MLGAVANYTVCPGLDVPVANGRANGRYKKERLSRKSDQKEGEWTRSVCAG